MFYRRQSLTLIIYVSGWCLFFSKIFIIDHCTSSKDSTTFLISFSFFSIVNTIKILIFLSFISNMNKNTGIGTNKKFVPYTSQKTSFLNIYTSIFLWVCFFGFYNGVIFFLCGFVLFLFVVSYFLGGFVLFSVALSY